MSKKDREKKPEIEFERKPWIQKTKGLQLIGLVALILATLVAYQFIRAGGNWSQGIFWGLVFGGSIFLVYFGMNAFHAFMNKNKNEDKDQNHK